MPKGIFILVFACSCFFVSCKGEAEHGRLSVSVDGAQVLDTSKEPNVREVVSEYDIGRGYTVTFSKGWFERDQGVASFAEVSLDYETREGDYVAYRLAFPLEKLPDNILCLPISTMVEFDEDIIEVTLGDVRIKSEWPEKSDLY